MKTMNWQAAIEHVGIYHHAVMGDDGYLVINRQLVPLLECICKLAGFEPKMRIADRIEDVRFCSMIFWPVEKDGDVEYVPGPTYRALLKYGCFQTPTPLGLDRLEQEIRGKALGLLPMCSHIPLLHHTNLHVLQYTQGRHGNAVNIAKRRIQIKHLAGASYPMSQSAYAFAARAYNVSESIVRQAADDITNAPWNVVINTPAMQELARAVYDIDG
jgi:hypothetical protein